MSDFRSYSFLSCNFIECFANAFTNGNFEQGNSNGWTIGGGSRLPYVSSSIQPSTYLPGGSNYNSTIATTHSSIVTSGLDPILGSLMANIVFDGQYSWRVEDLDIWGFASVLSQRVNSYFCLNMYFAWMAVLENGGHAAAQSSVVIIELKDATVDDVLLSRTYNAGAGSGGVDSRFNSSGSYYYTPIWQKETLTIDTSRQGHDFVLTVFVGDCQASGHRGYVYIDAFGSFPI